MNRVLLALTWLAASASAAEPAAPDRPEVLWYMSRSVSGSIQEGPQKGQGFMDLILRNEIQAALPDYRHRLIEAPPARWAQDALDLPNACHPTIRKTPERLGKYTLSVPMVRMLSVGVVVRQRDQQTLAPWINRAGALQLDRLLSERPMMLGVESARSHGEAIDQAIERYPRLVFRLSKTEAVPSLMRMLMLGRVDIVPAFGSDPYYLERQEDSLRGQLLWLPVEGQPETLTTHVACPKSAIGAQVIQRINEALEKHGARERAQALYEQRLPPDERQRLQRMRSGIKPAERFWQDPTP